MEAADIIRQKFGGDVAAFLAHAKQRVKDARHDAAIRRGSALNRWRQMMSRCFDPEHGAFHNYGGRGITVCERWCTFETYYADVGSPPKASLTLDRYPNNDGNYEPGNVRWATPTQQSANRRCTKRG